jgi:murein DD-endopeptidase MepM/ murein hydrolase activator NlpD
MNIILVPRGARKGVPSTLALRHLLMMILIGLIGLPITAGIITYHIHLMLDNSNGGRSALVRQEKTLAAQRAVIDRTRRDSEAQLNAMALKLGRLQAQVLRLNVLGGRLTRMAGLDPREFNFREQPAMGGPENKLAITDAARSDVVASLEQLEDRIDHQRERLMALETLMLDHKLSQAVTPSDWPVKNGGWISSGFGSRTDPFTGAPSFHDGIDIAARWGSPILATSDGIVTFTGERAGYGTVVEITHASNLITRYAHTSAVLVKVGDRVHRGQEIARVGSSGRSTGPHVHFEVLKNDRPVDPTAYLASHAGQARSSTSVAANTAAR